MGPLEGSYTREGSFIHKYFDMEAYCVKCRTKREMQDGKEVSFAAKGGQTRSAMQGVCPVCGTKLFRILGKKA